MTEAKQSAIPRKFKPRGKRGRQIKPPRTNRLENRYAARIVSMIDAVNDAVTRELLPQLDSIIEEQARDEQVHVAPRLDDAADRIARTFCRVKVFAEQTITLPKLQRDAERTGGEVNDVNSAFNTENVNAVLGVDVFTTEPWLETEMDHFIHENASLIQGITEEQLRDVEQSVFRNVRAGAGTSKIVGDIIGIVDQNKRRARLIARDQVNKFNGRLSQLRQASLGITEYTWRTSQDERVRKTHIPLDGTVQNWANPPVTVGGKGSRAGERNHPGMDIQCRCIAEPIFPKSL